MPDPSTNLTLKSLEDLYIQEKYDKLSDSLLDLRDELPRGLFHFNLGTTYAKKDQLAIGRYHLEKAIKEGYVTSKSLNNLNVVKQKLAISDISYSNLWTDNVLNYGVSVPLQLYLFVTLLLFLFLGVLRKFKGMFKEWKFFFVGCLIALFPFSTGVYFHQYDFAVALKEGEVHEGPSGVYEDKALLPGGAKVLIGKFYNGWYYIERPDGFRGWVKKDVLGLL